MPKVSVIVPIYGVEKFLRECLDSILSQSLKDIEIILIDDGGKDKCPQIIDEYAQKDNRIIAIHKENGGYGQTCNVGLERATGEYVAIVEPDDYINCKMYEDLYNLAQKYDVDIVKSSFYEKYDTQTNKSIKEINWNKKHDLPIGVFDIKKCPLFLYFHPSIWSCIYKREFLNRNNIRFVEAKGSGWTDNPFQVQTMCLAEKIFYTPQAYYYWRKQNDDEAIDLKDKTIPLKRSQEIHKWLEENKIDNREVLSCLYKRELTYIDLILKGTEIKDRKKSFEISKQILSLMNKDIIRYSTYFTNKERRKFKQLSNHIWIRYAYLKYKTFERKLLNQNKIALNNKSKFVYITDDNYILPTIISITSLYANKRKSSSYEVYIITNNISQDNRILLEKLGNKFSNITIINGEPFIKDYVDIKQQRHVTITSLIKFFLPQILKNEDKVLLIDGDTVIQRDLTELFNTNIKDVYAGVVKDTFTITDKEYTRENNINSDYYFNSGVMLLNLSKLRNENISKKLIEDKQQYQTMFMDQDTFNKVFGNNVLFLSCKYNFLNYYLEVFSTESLSSFFDEKLKNDEDKLYKSCYILHFGGVYKPWMHDMDLLTQIYKKYYKKSILRNKELKLKKCPYTRTFAEKLFSIKNNFSKTQKIITILGVKIKIKRGKSGK